MLSVLVVNDSEHATLKKSQRVIAKFLPQVGPATYMGAISREGLEDLEAELRAIRSRYLSIACYHVAHNLSPALKWVIGSKKNFDEDHSLYAHRRRALKPELPYFEGTYTAKLLSLTVRLAALTHDLGKMNAAFQANIWQACKGGARRRGEFIRHDAMSYRILRGFSWTFTGFGSLVTCPPADLATVVAAKSALELRETFTAHLTADLQRLSDILAPAKRRRGPAVTPLSLEELVCRIAGFLSITHHRLPGPSRRSKSSDISYFQSLTADTYFNPDQAPSFNECLQFNAGNVFQLDPSLSSTLTKVLADLAELTAKAPADFDQNTFLRLILMHGRPLLVLADHLASGMKSGEPVVAGTLLGNTVRAEDESIPATPGDTLATHIRSVYNHTRRQAQFALSLIANQPGILPETSLSAQRSIDAKRSLVGKFAWQAELHDNLKSNNPLPSFVAVTAGTGSGKTIASAQVMRALGSTRWTYCLGLRSLTLQTGRSYQQDLSLSAADVAVVIGDDVAKKAFEKENREACAAAGSESLTPEPEVTVVTGAQPSEWQTHLAPDRLRGALKNVFSARKLDFVAAPVVVCTIDQLIAVTRMTSISHELDYKRIQSADLVLDEIDNYSSEELKHIAILCFLVGLARKNLVCLSATMGPLHVEVLLAAFREGIRLNHELTGLGADLRFTAAANFCKPENLVLPAGAPLNDALVLNERFNLAARKAGLLQPPKAWLGLLNCKATDSPAILDEAIRLHRLNASMVNGTRVSAGFIKLNTVGSARNLAKHLLEVKDGLPDDVELAVVCYHARHTGLELSLIERALNQVTNRKHLPPGSEFSDDAIKQYLGPLVAGAGKPNLVVIVVTTSIIETGRDHDYDWAILEPSSNRSLIQAAGRVRRHREALLDKRQNVSLIAYPARACGASGYEPRNPVHVFSYPGPLTALAEKRFFDADLSYAQLLAIACEDLGVTAALDSDIARDACALGFLPSYMDGIRNAIALTPPRELTSSLAVLEQLVLFKSLTEPASIDVMSQRQDSVSAMAQLDKGMWLSSWAYQHSFRQADNTYFEDQVYLLQPKTLAAGRYCVTTPLTKLGTPAAGVIDERVVLANPFRSLLVGGAGGKHSLTELLALEARDLARAGFTASDLVAFGCYSPERRGLEPAKVFHNEHLGFNSRAVATI